VVEVRPPKSDEVAPPAAEALPAVDDEWDPFDDL
jgi:hypothetical protein